MTAKTLLRVILANSFLKAGDVDAYLFLLPKKWKFENYISPWQHLMLMKQFNEWTVKRLLWRCTALTASRFILRRFQNGVNVLHRQ